MFCRFVARGWGVLTLSVVILVSMPLHAANWLPFGPDGGSARRIEADPSDHTHLYLGAVNGWVYESHDDGATWRRLSRVAKRDDLVLDNIVIDPRDPRHVIVGAFALDQPDGGLFISNDAGKTWASQPEMRGQSIRALAAAPSDPKILVAGTLTGVFRSDDGGAHWKQISPPDSTEIHEVESVAIDPQDPNVIYAGTWHLPWKTTDGGEHWNSIKEGIIEDSDVFSIIVDPQSPKTVYASACSGIYKSDDAGDLFKKVQGIPSTARRTRVLMQDPTNLAVVFAGTTEGLWRSDDSGKTWNRMTGPEVIVNDVEIDRTDSKRVLIATDRGGILASEDGGTTFHPSNSGFSSRQITAMKRDFRHPARVLVGVVNDKEWGGVFESGNGGLNWKQVSDGLSGRDVFSLGQAPDGTMIAGTSHGLFRLDPAAGTWVKVEQTPIALTRPDNAAQGPATPVHPPVPVGRNEYVKSGAAGTARSVPSRLPRRGATAQHRTSASVAKRSIPAKKTHGTVSRRSVAVHGKKGERTKSHIVIAKVNRPAARPVAPPPPRRLTAAVPAGAAAVPTESKGFDGSVYAITTAGQNVLAATSLGLMTSADNGMSWTLSGPDRSDTWRFLASAKTNVVAASLHSLSFSADAGANWSPIVIPEALTQVGAAAVVPSGEIWVGGREGVFVSSDAGHHWETPKNLFVNSVNSIYYDEGANRVMLTTAGYSDLVFLVQLPTKQVTFMNTGWNLRFARPMGDHLIAATPFDGIVIQPRMVTTPMQGDVAPQPGSGAPLNAVNGAPGSP